MIVTNEYLVAFLVVGAFVSGVVVGMLLYRAMWHMDTKDLRIQIDTLQRYNTSLLDEAMRQSVQLQEFHVRMQTMEEEAQTMRAELRMAAKRERQGYPGGV